MANVLKSIELQGFKSFASKTVIELTHSVTGIVGPNGSGKSNVIDALRWCLGEREAKQLRGETLENLIFAGTPKRPAVSLAKVILTFDNRDRIFPVETAETTIERRIDRSGESQFLVNGEEVKLKELTPLLARAKLGTRGLTMIGQGQSDLFIRSSPYDRRMMVEEVLGLREFRIKKVQAERRLESSEVNIEKLQAMLEELQPHLKFLKRQQSRYEKRAELEVELRRLEDEYFSHHIRELEMNRLAQIAPQKQLVEQRLELLSKVSEKDREIALLDRAPREDQELRIIREHIQALGNRRLELQREQARVEAKLELQRATPVSKEHTREELVHSLVSLKDELQRVLLLSDFSELKAMISQLVKRIELFFAKSTPIVDAELELRERELKNLITQVEREIQEVRVREEGCVSRFESERQAYRLAVRDREMLKSSLSDIEKRLQDVEFSLERISLKSNELHSQWLSFGRSEADFLRLAHFDFSSVSLQPDALHKMSRLRGELSIIGEIDEKLLQEAREAESRFSVLSKEYEDLLHAKTGLLELIRDLETRIHSDFKRAFTHINEEFSKYFALMFGGGKARLHLKTKAVDIGADQQLSNPLGASHENSESSANNNEENAGIEVELSLPRKRITSLEMLSGGERSLVSLAALFALISVSPPPFLILDEIDAPLDETNARRFSDLIKDFSERSQFIMITHNRVTMEAADVLFGVTMGDDGSSRLFSMKLEQVSSS